MGYLASMRIWRGNSEAGQLEEHKVEVSEGEVVVRNQADPIEIEQEEEKFKDKDIEYKVKMGADYDKSEKSDVKPDELYGDKYNTKFLKELKKLSDERKKETKAPKLKDPDVPVSGPEIGDGKSTNTKSPVARKG